MTTATTTGRARGWERRRRGTGGPGEDSWRGSSNRDVVVNVDVAIKEGGEGGVERRVEKKIVGEEGGYDDDDDSKRTGGRGGGGREDCTPPPLPRKEGGKGDERVLIVRIVVVS